METRTPPPTEKGEIHINTVKPCDANKRGIRRQGSDRSYTNRTVRSISTTTVFDEARKVGLVRLNGETLVVWAADHSSSVWTPVPPTYLRDGIVTPCGEVS